MTCSCGRITCNCGIPCSCSESSCKCSDCSFAVGKLCKICARPFDVEYNPVYEVKDDACTCFLGESHIQQEALDWFNNTMFAVVNMWTVTNYNTPYPIAYPTKVVQAFQLNTVPPEVASRRQVYNYNFCTQANRIALSLNTGHQDLAMHACNDADLMATSPVQTASLYSALNLTESSEAMSEMTLPENLQLTPSTELSPCPSPELFEYQSDRQTGHFQMRATINPETNVQVSQKISSADNLTVLNNVNLKVKPGRLLSVPETVPFKVTEKKYSTSKAKPASGKLKKRNFKTSDKKKNLFSVKVKNTDVSNPVIQKLDSDPSKTEQLLTETLHIPLVTNSCSGYQFCVQKPVSTTTCSSESCFYQKLNSTCSGLHTNKESPYGGFDYAHSKATSSIPSMTDLEYDYWRKEVKRSKSFQLIDNIASNSSPWKKYVAEWIDALPPDCKAKMS